MGAPDDDRGPPRPGSTPPAPAPRAATWSRRRVLGALGATGLTTAGALAVSSTAARPQGPRARASGAAPGERALVPALWPAGTSATTATGGLPAPERQSRPPTAVAVTARSVDAAGLHLRFSVPLLPAAGWPAAPAVPLSQPSPSEVFLPAEPTPYSGVLLVQSRDGYTLPVQVAVPGLPLAPVHYFGDPAGGRVYLTIDDGWFPSQEVLARMRADRLPLTTFLIEDAAREHPEFWREFTAARGLIMNHTVSHPLLTHLPVTQVAAQWTGPARAYPSWYGGVPSLGRPPYGAVEPQVQAQARRAGIEALVMWGVVAAGHGVQTWNRGPIQAGDIVLMHWDPGLAAELATVLAQVRTARLTPALLTPDRLIHPGVTPAQR